MSAPEPQQPSFSFVKTFVLPALLIFLVPVLSWIFFRHAESTFDDDAREATIEQILADDTMSREERDKAMAFFREVPFSKLVLIDEFAADVDSTTLNYYLMFRWLIRLSAWSVIGGAVVLLLAGVCVLLSLRSQRAQFWCLSIGWQVLRIYGAVQAAVQGVLLVALSFWVTALWFNSYYPKLIFLAGLAAFVAVAAVVKGIFKRTKSDHVVEGTVIDRSAAPALWTELEGICAKVGTTPPDQIVAGIDDNFYVTEMPVTVGDQVYSGRTLYVSLSMLKQMRGAEADAILAHEMAHFSGNDTLYSKKISPLLARYHDYLQALYEGGITRPIFYFMNCFRGLYELSLSRHSRQREFRADRIAAETTSPRDFASGLLRVAAYSSFRNDVQHKLFDEERALENANILERIEQGFHDFAVKFATDPEIGNLETSHPFDTHPPLHHRLGAIGVPLKSQDVTALLGGPATGRWYQKINDAEQLEREQWDEFESRFRAMHQESLPYRFLPETEEERNVVLQTFPGTTIEGKDGSLELTYESINYSAWPEAVRFHEITNIALDEQGTLQLQFTREKKQKCAVKLKTFGKRQQEALDEINRYYGRYRSAVAYRDYKQQQLAATASA